MERFKEVLKNRHEYGRAWKKRTGGKVIGYYEPYMPEEIVYAAGYLPVRLFSRHEADDITDRQMYGNCACSRDSVTPRARTPSAMAAPAKGTTRSVLKSP